MAAYSFKNVTCSIVGHGGTVDDAAGAGSLSTERLGHGAGVSDEGITIERTEDRNTMTTGSDTHVMHSLHSADSGTVTLRYLKTSPANGMLMRMFTLQSASAAFWGNNVITVTDKYRLDNVKATEVAFTGPPSITFAKVGTVYEWAFHAGHIEGQLFDGARAAEVGASGPSLPVL